MFPNAGRGAIAKMFVLGNLSSKQLVLQCNIASLKNVIFKTTHSVPISRLLSAISCCVADVTTFIVTMIYCFSWSTATGNNTSKRPSITSRGENLRMPTTQPSSILPPRGRVSLPVIVWPSVSYQASHRFSN